jgi:hypothetical protein
MTRFFFCLLVLGAAFSSCGDCALTEATGVFEIYKANGCFTLSEGSGNLVEIFHYGDPTPTSATDLKLGLLGPLYVGRRGTCGLTYFGSEGATPGSHCDFQVRSVATSTPQETRYGIEVLDAVTPSGNFKGLVWVNLRKETMP